MSEQKTHYQNIKVTALPDAEVEIEGEIDAQRMNDLRNKALDTISKEIEIPGFRKGKAPTEIVVKKVGEMRLLEEAAEMALQEEYPIILFNEKINAIGLPHIHITKLAPGNPLGFKLHTAVMPTITLPDYMRIAKTEMEKKDSVEVEEKEIDRVIEEIRKQKAGKKEKDASEENELPALTDEFVKSLGNFEHVEDFKNKIKENLSYEKKIKAREKKRGATIDELLKKSSITLPKILIVNELEKMLSQFTGEVEHMGITWNDYLAQTKKTEEELKNEWRPTAEKRAKTQLILDEIAVKEKIEPEEDQVKKEVEHILSHYPKADPERARVYVKGILRNEKVFEFLESGLAKESE
ncbi:MAG: trigger factor [Patescibacteria group bacterium]|nr:trigger factor [bacterium]MDZ4241103.1 trigger factor [Patescibacteria group bacterium]